MAENRLFFIVSIPETFKDKFYGFIKNINMVNSEKYPLVVIESVYIKKFVAVPIKQKEEG